MSARVQEPALCHMAEHGIMRHEPDLLFAAHIHAAAAHRERHHHNVDHRLNDLRPVVHAAGNAAIRRQRHEQAVEQIHRLARARPAVLTRFLKRQKRHHAAAQAAHRVALGAAHPHRARQRAERPNHPPVNLADNALDQLRRHRVQPRGNHLHRQRQIAGRFRRRAIDARLIRVGQRTIAAPLRRKIVGRRHPAALLADRPDDVGQLHVIAPVRHDAAANHQITQHFSPNPAVFFIIGGNAGAAEADIARGRQHRNGRVHPLIRARRQALPLGGGQLLPGRAILGGQRHDKLRRALHIDQQPVPVFFQHNALRQSTVTQPCSAAEAAMQSSRRWSRAPSSSPGAGVSPCASAFKKLK